MSKLSSPPADCCQNNQLPTHLVDLSSQLSDLNTSLQNLRERLDQEMATQKRQSEELMRQLIAQKSCDNFLVRGYRTICEGLNSFWANVETLQLLLLSTITCAVLRMKYGGFDDLLVGGWNEDGDDGF